MEQYKDSPEIGDIQNKGINVLISEMDVDQRNKFFNQLEKSGLGKYIQKKPVELHPPSDEEVIEFKKGLIDFLKGGTKMKQTKHNITEAILIGKQFAFSMPKRE